MRSGLGLKAGSSVSRVLSGVLASMPLKTSILAIRGAVPTFTRASTAMVTDFEGNTWTCLPGEARFQGMRRVQNLYTSSSTLSTQSNTVVAGVYLVQFKGMGSVTLSGTGTGTINGTGTGNLVWGLVSTSAGTLTSTVSGVCTSGQLENVTNQSVQTPGEYVSTGVLSYPYQGAGVDGVQYFATKLDGTAIIGGGYLNEPARTNLLLNSAVPATQSITATAQNYTVSFYGTGSCTLTGMASGTLNGTGVNNRVSLTVAATAGVVLATFSGSTTNGQFENGPNMSSYIATTGTTASRAADHLEYSIPNLPQKNFTIAAEIMKPQLSTASSGANAPVQIGSYQSNASLVLGGYILGSETVLGAWPTVWNLVSSASVTPYVAGVSTKSAWAFDNDGLTLRSAFSGALIAARTANAAKTSNWSSSNIGIGSPPSGSSVSDAMPFVISNVRLYNKALPDAALKAL